MLRKINHGEVVFYEVESFPSNIKKINVKQDHFVVGESETHGNDHRVSTIDTSVFTKDDVLFLESIGNTKIYCPNKTRHDTIELPDGKWRVGHAQEYDYFEENYKRVID